LCRKKPLSNSTTFGIYFSLILDIFIQNKKTTVYHKRCIFSYAIQKNLQIVSYHKNFLIETILIKILIKLSNFKRDSKLYIHDEQKILLHVYPFQIYKYKDLW
jgi:hypothetical protein